MPDTPALPLPDETAWRIASSEVAALAGVQRPVVTTWARRHPDFPAPVAHEHGRVSYSGRAVVDWLLETGRGNADPRHLRAELALHTLNAWRGTMPAADLVGALTALICLRQQLDRPVTEPTWEAVLAHAADLDAEDTFLLGELRSVPTKLGLDLTVLADELTEAAYNPAEAFEWVLEARHRLGAHELAADEPAPLVVEALARLSGIEALADGAVVAVPNARAGGMLAALHDAAAPDGGHTYLAAETERGLARLVRRRMLVRDVYEIQLDVADGTELAVDDWGDPNLLLCALPYEAAETRDPNAALERVEALTDLLGDGCTAVVLGPADALTGPLPQHGDADRLRRSFLTEGLLKAAVSLPEGAIPYRPGHRTAVWILSRTPREERRGLVLLADYSAQPLTEHALGALGEDIGIWRAAGWSEDRHHKPHHGAVVRAKDLDDRPGTAFTPPRHTRSSRYTRTVVERPAQISELEVHLEALLEEHRRAAESDPGLRTHAALRPDNERAPRTTVGRLLKARRLRKLPGHRIAAEHITDDGHYPVLGPYEVTGTATPGARRIDRGILLTAYEHAVFTESGDIVYTANPHFGAYVDEEGLSVVVYPAKVLRVRTDTIRPLQPRVLAALLHAAAVEHPRATGAVRASRRIEDLAIPDLGLAEAQRYEALLTDIERRRALLRRQIDALEELSRLTAAGVGDGTLAITPGPATTANP